MQKIEPRSSVASKNFMSEANSELLLLLPLLFSKSQQDDLKLPHESSESEIQ
jgi:hypothetical protein